MLPRRSSNFAIPQNEGFKCPDWDSTLLGLNFIHCQILWRCYIILRYAVGFVKIIPLIQTFFGCDGWITFLEDSRRLKRVNVSSLYGFCKLLTSHYKLQWIFDNKFTWKLWVFVTIFIWYTTSLLGRFQLF